MAAPTLAHTTDIGAIAQKTPRPPFWQMWGGKLAAHLALMRPHQWTKNLACFAGLFFSGKALMPSAVSASIGGFSAFCCAASFVYALNDILDRNRDKAHPLKMRRPIPSGRLTVAQAALTAFACLAGALAISLLTSPAVCLLVCCYILLNIAYSLWLKHLALLDVMLISCGFILRILGGTEAITVPASAWILLCAFFLSLFLGFGKRRAELSLWSKQSGKSRSLLSQYSVPLLDRYCNIFAGLSIAAYALFTVTSRMDRTLLITCPPVVFGLLRYLLLIETRRAGESPDLILLRDRPLQAAILLWTLLSLLVLYAGLRIQIA